MTLVLESAVAAGVAWGYQQLVARGADEREKAAALQIEKLIKRRRNPKNQTRLEVRARSPDRSARLTCVMRSTSCAGAASIKQKTRGSPSTTCVPTPCWCSSIRMACAFML